MMIPTFSDSTYLVLLVVLLASLLVFLFARQQARIRREMAHHTAELSQAKARLQRVIDSSKLGFWDWDLARDSIQYSGCWASMLGYRLDELEHSYATWAERVHPDDKPVVEAAMDDLLQGRCEEYEHDHRLRTRSGEWRWIRTSASALSRSEAGKPLYISGTHTDIHDKKQLELALKASEQQLHEANATLERRVVARTAQLRVSEGFMRALINALNVHIVVLDVDGGLLTCNESWRAFVEKNGGRSESVRRGVNYFSVCGPAEQDGTPAAALIRQVMQGKRRQAVFEYASGSNGQQHWFQCKVCRFRVGEGAIQVVLSHENITLRKQAELALKQLNDQLEQRVLARTEQLQQAQEGAEQASQAKSQFLATMSHEIRTPLNGVIGMVDVLEQTRLDAKQKGMVDLIRISGLSLLSIIDDILDFSKIEAGHLELDPAPFSMTALVEQCCAMVDNQASNRGVELRMFTDPQLAPLLLGDELRIRQVLLNLASNAIKFSSEGDGGQVSVRVTLEGASAQQVRVLLQVADNGIGMSEEAQASLFTAFKQADASTTRRFGGTGLGLAISLHLVNMMQGEISVQSAPGEGSVFSVSLPLQRLPDEGAEAPVPESKVSGLDCLVVGSAQSLAEDLCVYLRHGGCRTERVFSLEEAQCWQLQQGEGLYVWVVDIERQARQMPGFELAAEVAPGQEVVFVQIERGQRRFPRRTNPQRVEVDGNVLSRDMLLAAVTYASRRELLEPVDWSKKEAVVADVLPTRDEALAQGRLILVAEDNKVNQKVLMQQLGLLGYTADIADNGAQALELWRNGSYAVLLTDLHMPEMDGYQLTRALRAEQTEQTRLPIIALTANALKGEAQRCKDIGMDDFLSKPARLELLREMLDKWMPGASGQVKATAVPGAAQETVSAVAVPAADDGELAEPAREAGGEAEPDGGSQSAVLDTAELAALVGDDPQAILELLQDFRHYGQQTSIELLQAYENREAGGVCAMAHKLKSSARSVGAVRLSEYCAQLEEAARGEDMHRVDELIPLFRVQMDTVDQRIAAL